MATAGPLDSTNTVPITTPDSVGTAAPASVPAPVPASAAADGIAPVTLATVEREVLSPAFRTWVYGVVVALSPLLVAYGIVNGVQASLWCDAVAAVLAVTSGTLAIANVKK